MSVLRYSMVVRDPDTSEAVALRAGEPVPDWAKSLVHADDLENDKSAEKSKPTKKAAASRSKK